MRRFQSDRGFTVENCFDTLMYSSSRMGTGNYRNIFCILPHDRHNFFYALVHILNRKNIFLLSHDITVSSLLIFFTVFLEDDLPVYCILFSAQVLAWRSPIQVLKPRHKLKTAAEIVYCTVCVCPSRAPKDKFILKLLQSHLQGWKLQQLIESKRKNS